MSLCDKCIHRDVCGYKDVGKESVKSCCDFIDKSILSVLEREKGTDLEEIVKEIKRERAYRENRNETEEMCEVDVILRIIEPYVRGKDNETK